VKHRETLRLSLMTTLPSSGGGADDMLATLVKPRVAWAEIHEQARKIAERNALRLERERQCEVAERRARAALCRLSGFVTLRGWPVRRREIVVAAVALVVLLAALAVLCLS
jgi:hypothetical protein